MLKYFSIFPENLKKYYMKKLILLFLGLAIFANVNAQKFGVKAGADLSSMYSNPSGDYNVQTGFNGAVFFEKSFFPMLSLRPEIGYYQKGYNYVFLGQDFVTKINYAQFDLTLNVKPPFIPIYIMAGPYFSYALSGETSINSLSVATTFDKDHTSPLDYGISAGLGYQFNLVVAKLIFEVVYNYGLYDYNQGSSYVSNFNRNLSLDLGIVIGL